MATGAETMQQPGEPSVEEILESIKKVIARENGPATAPARRRSAAEPVEPAAPEEAEEVLELDENAMLALEEEADDDRFTADEADEPADAPLTGDATASAMRENFAALAMLAQPGRQPQIVRSGETSLEGLTRELLRPMLAQWLDDNLPAMVEELVKAEIARIAGKKG
jgi:uncharacterized protein